MDRIHNILNDIDHTLKTSALVNIQSGDVVKNINTVCKHFGSQGVVEMVDKLPDEIGYVVSYRTTNAGKTWEPGQILKKTADQLQKVGDDTDLGTDYPVDIEMTSRSEDDNMEEYKNEFLEMSIGSIRAIVQHAQNIIDSLDNPVVKNNLTESWLQGKIAITEDYMRTIHDFIMFVVDDDDTSEGADRPGLWENIRNKRKKEGKKYRPAKRGDKDRPDPKQWKKLTE
jgi:hypothetical protein